MSPAAHAAARALLADPLTNKGTAFTEAERDQWGLHGLLPPHVGTLDSQIERRQRALAGMPDDFHRYSFLRELQDSNEILFHAMVQRDLPAMLPLVYTPTVGEGCERFSEIWRRPRGLFLSWPNRHRIAEILGDPALDRVKVIVVSDGERILGLGDQGAGGMGIPIGKLALYTACAGIHPSEVLPILLDVGTDNAERREDPLYVGWRHPRIRGAEYDAFVEDFVTAVADRFPGVLLQWEDFAGHNAYKLLDRYRNRLLSFNDDIQGTAATAVGTLLSAIGRTGAPLGEQRIVLFGAGAAGCGIADMLVQALKADGLDAEQARGRIWAVDRNGLILSDMGDLSAGQRSYARDPAEVEGWTRTAHGDIDLFDTVANIHPTVLIGASGQHGAFSEAVVRTMAQAVERPVIFPLSNPVSRAEAHPTDLTRWSAGRAVIGTGSPFGITGVTQVNNVYIFPGVGLGALAAQAHTITDGMFMAAARALGAMGGDDTLLPPIERLRDVALDIAVVVAAQAVADKVAAPDAAIDRDTIAARMWQPAY
ncbi:MULTISPECIES: NAD-dependent malic enzyme [Sphingomonas]|jgi:malate dehydrogenase (oxaloacetate-decarboxylating)|uniref:NAD-dependent malic enzyme n=1 Tax=Sphingomonas TaxID=13687 RepID=UPI000A806C2B|nr:MULTISPECIES: NAD-dependent malic enzyme [Sphingomonas]PZT93714.1 MAG: NAD-dependent malic enzyme [Sphingomonas sp.]WCP70701.1 NAD-dependent malic enzyme [Sphingomonas hankookensis]